MSKCVTYLGMVLKVGHLKFELVRSPEIVLIKKREEFSSGSVDAMVSRRCHTLICLMDETRIMKALSYNTTLVHRPIIHNDYFKGAIGLCEDAVQGGPKILCPVVDRNDYTHNGMIFAHSLDSSAGITTSAPSTESISAPGPRLLSFDAGSGKAG